MLEMNDDLTKMRQATAQVASEPCIYHFSPPALPLALCFTSEPVVLFLPFKLSFIIYSRFRFINGKLEVSCY